VQLAHPARFVSIDGRLLFKLEATNDSGDISLTDPYQDLAVSGTGVVT
jgi:hypothetical protein